MNDFCCSWCSQPIGSWSDYVEHVRLAHSNGDSEYSSTKESPQ